jgi:hypothetical protein
MVQQPATATPGSCGTAFLRAAVTLRYFFERATPEWLVPLRDAGFFSLPPKPVLHDDMGTLEVPP